MHVSRQKTYYIHTNIHTCTQDYKYTYIYTDIHETHIHAYIQT